MRRFALLTILSLTLLLSLFATDTTSTPNVLTTNQEITAYKRMPNATDNSSEDLSTDDYTLSFRFVDPTSSSTVSSGGDLALTSTTLTESNYSENDTFDTAFKWEMVGNVFKDDITVTFTFGPLCSETISPSSTMTVTDGSKVIPYTVTLTSYDTTVDGISGTIGTTAITYNTRESYSYYETEATSPYSGNTHTYYVYCADERSYTNNNVYVTTSPKTVTFECSMYNNSFIMRENKKDDYRSYFSTINDWTRTGYGSVTLGLNSDGCTWTDTVDGESVTYKVPSGDTTFKANVVVEITVGT